MQAHVLPCAVRDVFIRGQSHLNIQGTCSNVATVEAGEVKWYRFVLPSTDISPTR